MIDRQVYNHPCTKIIYNSVYFVLFNLSCIVVQHETDLQNILWNPRIIIFPTRIFLTFIKLSYNKLISTRYLSDIGYLTFRSFDEKRKKKSQDNLQGSSLFHHHHHLILTLSKQFVRSTRGRACTTRKDLYHRIQFTEHNWPITSRDENISRILSLGCRVTGRLSATLLFSGCAVMRDYSVCVR